MAKLFQDIFKGSKGGMDNFLGSMTGVIEDRDDTWQPTSLWEDRLHIGVAVLL
jgi:hypothetical protein